MRRNEKSDECYRKKLQCIPESVYTDGVCSEVGEIHPMKKGMTTGLYLFCSSSWT